MVASQPRRQNHSKMAQVRQHQSHLKVENHVSKIFSYCNLDPLSNLIINRLIVAWGVSKKTCCDYRHCLPVHRFIFRSQ